MCTDAAAKGPAARRRGCQAAPHIVLDDIDDVRAPWQRVFFPSYIRAQCVVDVLHLLLRIIDTLLKNVIEKGTTQPNQTAAAQAAWQKRFLDAVHALGVGFSFYTARDDEDAGGKVCVTLTGCRHCCACALSVQKKLRYTSLMGPDKLKLLNGLDVAALFVDSPTWRETAQLWSAEWRVRGSFFGNARLVPVCRDLRSYMRSCSGRASFRQTTPPPTRAARVRGWRSLSSCTGPNA